MFQNIAHLLGQKENVATYRGRGSVCRYVEQGLTFLNLFFINFSQLSASEIFLFFCADAPRMQIFDTRRVMGGSWPARKTATDSNIFTYIKYEAEVK